MRSVLWTVALSLAALGGAAAAQAQPAPVIGGDWQGDVKVRKDSLPIVIHLGAAVTGDSPAERIFGEPGKLVQAGDRYKVTLQSGGEFEGALTKEGRLQGTYTKGDLTVPLVLEKQAAPKP
jgi:hypothetical protein